MNRLAPGLVAVLLVFVVVLGSFGPSRRDIWALETQISNLKDRTELPDPFEASWIQHIGFWFTTPINQLVLARLEQPVLNLLAREET